MDRTGEQLQLARAFLEEARRALDLVLRRLPAPVTPRGASTIWRP